MRRLICTFALVALTGLGSAQLIRIEKTNPATADDLKPDTPAVPDVYGLTGQFDRVLVVRLKHQTDLLDGLQRIANQEKVRNAVIISGIGSVKSYHYHTVSSSTFPTKNVFVKNPAGPADITSLNGYVIDGRVHVHITLADAEKAFGGHLERGTTVLTFAIVTIGVFKDGIDLSRADDKHHR